MSGYLAYVNDKPVRFIALHEAGQSSLQPGGLIAAEEDLGLEQLLLQLSGPAAPTAVLYLCADPKRVWSRFLTLFTLSVAAGGVVVNDEGKILVIRRRGKWDLPKGKLDYDETPEQAAVREVKEECGLQRVDLGPALPVTFHTYTEKKKSILKKTHWYRMRTEESVLVPQAEEDIERAEWMNESEVRSTVFPDTYHSVHDLLLAYYANR